MTCLTHFASRIFVKSFIVAIYRGFLSYSYRATYIRAKATSSNISKLEQPSKFFRRFEGSYIELCTCKNK